MSKKRVLGTLLFFITMIGLLIARLVQLQLVETEQFSKYNINLLEESVRQRSQEMVIDDGRGSFLYRNGEMITHKTMPVLILFPFLKEMNWNKNKLASIIGVSQQSLTEAVENAKEPFVFGAPVALELTELQITQINNLRIPGVFAVERKYERPEIPAEQLIGLVGENEKELNKRYPEKDLNNRTMIGVSGLEESFDEFLLGDGKGKLVYHVDGDGAPLFGTSVRYTDTANPFYPVNIKTTIDKRIQERAEDLVSLHNVKKGGLVLLDIDTNSILAMVSRPVIDKKDPFSSQGISNSMLKEQVMGSVFKTVIAAAALDYGLDGSSRTFNCSQKINGEPDLKYNHGMLNFKDSFARSCNNTFAQLAKELSEKDPGIIEDYAEKLSLTERVGWTGDVYHLSNFRQLSEEEKGRVFRSSQDRSDKNYVALSGIGQHEVRATPIGVANMMATIARGGKKEYVRAVSEIEYKDGTEMFKFDKKNLEGGEIAPYTAMSLQKLLREVVVNSRGTGRAFQGLPYDIAGKSGTAETGKFKNEVQLHNKWFAGYFPFEKPRYALVTVNLDVFENEGGINPLYADMVKMLYEIDHNE